MLRTCIALLGALAVATAAPAAKQKDPVKVTSPKVVKGIQRIVIGQVTIAFLMERKDSSKAGGGLMGNGMGGRSTTRSTLTGTSPDDFQLIADAAYEDLVARLTAAGFEVIDRAPLLANAAFAKSKPLDNLHEMKVTTGRDDNAVVRFVAAQQTAPLRLNMGDTVTTGFSAMGAIMNGTQVMNGLTAFAKESGANVVNVIYYVDFADAEEYGGWFRSSSAVSVKGSLALLPDQSKMTVVAPNYKSATLALANPVAVGGNFFRAEDTTSTESKVMQGVANAIGILGGVGTNSTRRLSFRANPETYIPGATEAVADANQVLVGRLAALR